MKKILFFCLQLLTKNLLSLQGAEMGNQGRKGMVGRPRASAGPAPGIKWEDLEQYTVHLSGSASKGRYQCTMCERILSDKKCVLQHIMRHHFPAGTFEFSCDGCNKKFDTPQKSKTTKL